MRPRNHCLCGVRAPVRVLGACLAAALLAACAILAAPSRALAATGAGSDLLAFDERAGRYTVNREVASVADDRARRACADANVYLRCRLDLTVGGVVVASLDPQAVRDWVVVDADGSVSLDEAALRSWAAEVESFVDSAWDRRTYVRPDGKEVTVGPGTYGWISNGAELASLVERAVRSGYMGVAPVPLKQAAAVFNPQGADWGPSYVDVDLSEQRVRFYGDDGSLIWESPCISGETDGVHETPTGVYYLRAKMTDQLLIGLPDPQTGEPEYRIFVNYWMPFIDNMYALHDNPYADTFGGTLNQRGEGSHGCVNLPLGKTRELFELIAVGTPVVVHH